MISLRESQQNSSLPMYLPKVGHSLIPASFPPSGWKFLSSHLSPPKPIKQTLWWGGESAEENLTLNSLSLFLLLPLTVLFTFTPFFQELLKKCSKANKMHVLVGKDHACKDCVYSIWVSTSVSSHLSVHTVGACRGLGSRVEREA